MTTNNSNIQVASHVPLVYTPRFWDPRKAYMNYVPDVEGAYREGVELKLANGLKSAHRLMQQGVRHAIMLTDLQQGFRDDDELPVSGTNTVVLRVSARIVNGTVEDYYTSYVYSLDGHPTQHISFDYYWRDSNGNPLDLSRHNRAGCLTLDDEDKAVFRAYGFGANGPYDIGYYRAAFDPMDAVDYWKHLQATGQGDIWAFVAHCMIGTNGANLHPFLQETLAFVAGARSIQPTVLNKGHISNTDWFGPLVACRPDPSHPQGGFQKQIVDDAFKPADTVDFAGVAQDFCDYNMKRQTMEYLAGTEYLERLRFITDGTAPIIPNAAHVLELNKQAEDAGVIFITHDSPFE
jgi:nicotinamidase/pyrazinamidase